MRISILAILTANILAVSAFTGPIVPRSFSTSLFLSTKIENDVPITITGNNIELTPALVDYVNQKLDRPLGKLASNGAILECDVHLSVNKNPKVKNAHKVEVTTNVKGTTLRSSEESPDMYASIDAVADRLARKLRRYKERRLDGYHGGKAMGEDIADAIEDTDVATTDAAVPTTGEDFVDPEAPVVTKIKSFDLGKPISLQEAIFALDYIDHDFYVFRDADTQEINVVYKRNAGGLGLIQPQQ